MSIFFEVDVVTTSTLLVEMQDGETAEMAQKVAANEANYTGSISVESARHVTGSDLTRARSHCDDTISL